VRPCPRLPSPDLPRLAAQELREDIEKSGDVNSEKERQAAEDLIEAAQGKARPPRPASTALVPCLTPFTLPRTLDLAQARPPFWLEEFGALARRWQSLDFDFDEDVEQALAASPPPPPDLLR
jgi:hypothetical protein